MRKAQPIAFITAAVFVVSLALALATEARSQPGGGPPGGGGIPKGGPPGGGGIPKGGFPGGGGMPKGMPGGGGMPKGMPGGGGMPKGMPGGGLGRSPGFRSPQGGPGNSPFPGAGMSRPPGMPSFPGSSPSPGPGSGGGFPGAKGAPGSNYQRPGGGPSSGPGANRPGSAPGGNPMQTGRSAPGMGNSPAQLNDFLGGRNGANPGSGFERPGTGNGNGIGPGNAADSSSRPGRESFTRPNGNGENSRPFSGDRQNAARAQNPARGAASGNGTGNGSESQTGTGSGGETGSETGNASDYSANPQDWINQLQSTGNGVRENSGEEYADAYRSGEYLAGAAAAGGYAYAVGWAQQGEYYGWAATTYETLANYLGSSYVSAKPTYYAYGAGGNVYFQQNTAYVNGQPAGTTQQYAEQSAQAVQAAPTPSKTPKSTWLPLGVYALTREGVTDSQIMMELAINKQGVIAGTYYNEITGLSRPLKGTLNAKTQRVGIGFADGKSTDLALETGITNLTRNEAPGLMHFGGKESQPVLLVRLKKPKAKAKS